MPNRSDTLRWCCTCTRSVFTEKHLHAGHDCGQLALREVVANGPWAPGFRRCFRRCMGHVQQPTSRKGNQRDDTREE